jgi:hypothetical protein
MNAVILLHDLAVVGEAVPAKLVGASYTCSRRESQQQHSLGEGVSSTSLGLSTASLATRAVVALPDGVAAPAKLVPTLDT